MLANRTESLIHAMPEGALRFSFFPRKVEPTTQLQEERLPTTPTTNVHSGAELSATTIMALGGSKPPPGMSRVGARECGSRSAKHYIYAGPV